MVAVRIFARCIRDKQNQIFQGPNFSAEKFSQSSGRRPVESLKNLFCLSKKIKYKI